jgi:hypothetical protein
MDGQTDGQNDPYVLPFLRKGDTKMRNYPKNVYTVTNLACVPEHYLGSV